MCALRKLCNCPMCFVMADCVMLQHNWACIFARMVISPAGKSGQASRRGPHAEGAEGRKKRQRMQGPLVYMPSQLPEQLPLLRCVQRTRLQVMRMAAHRSSYESM